LRLVVKQPPEFAGVPPLLAGSTGQHCWCISVYMAYLSRIF
jgi:hypothetical protein